MTKLTETVEQLTADLGVLDGEVASLRWQLQSFYQQLEDDDALLALPENFNPDDARKRMDALLRDRILVKGKLADAEAAHEQARRVESQKLKADLTRRYKATVKALLAASIALAHAVRDAEAIREEARRAFGFGVAWLPHIGPPAGMWELRDQSAMLNHWGREAVAAGLLDKADKAFAELKL